MILTRGVEVKIVPRGFVGFGVGLRRRVSVAVMAALRVAATKLGTLYGGDAIEWLGSLDAESVDLIFADPPYNLGRERWDALGSPAEYLAWSARWIAAAARALKRDGSLYICGFSEVLADIKAVAAPHFAGCRWLVWYYRNKANLGRDWGRSHESILHLRRPDFALDVDAARVPYNAHTLRYPSHPQAESSRYGGKPYVWQPNPLGAKPRDVFEVPTLTNGMREKTAHPTQKPLELVRRLVAAGTRSDGLVVDPFGGSGTTFVACEALGRPWLGCEIDPDFQRLIAERLAAPVDVVVSDGAEARRRAQRRKLR
jgi:site-specific DNA-methyltransferase (adenine-specific)